MSAQHIFDHAPLGSLIRYSNKTPKPLARFINKVRAWEHENGVGRLIRKEPAVQRATWASPACITLPCGNYSSHGTVVLTVRHSHCVTSPLEFSVVGRPAPGSILVLKHWAGSVELLHVADDRAAAEFWLKTNHYSDAILEEVLDETPTAAPEAAREANDEVPGHRSGP